MDYRSAMKGQTGDEGEEAGLPAEEGLPAPIEEPGMGAGLISGCQAMTCEHNKEGMCLVSPEINNEGSCVNFSPKLAKANEIETEA